MPPRDKPQFCNITNLPSIQSIRIQWQLRIDHRPGYSYGKTATDRQNRLLSEHHLRKHRFPESNKPVGGSIECLTLY